MKKIEIKIEVKEKVKKGEICSVILSDPERGLKETESKGSRRIYLSKKEKGLSAFS